LEKWSEKQADKYYKLIIDACSEIAKKPEKGKDYSIIYPALLGYKIAKHIIFYRIVDKYSIEITRILHEEMDLKLRLEK
jgi:toxin ParE1/3/4